MTAELDLLVRDRERLADGVVGLTLSHPAGEPVPAWAPGAHLDVVLGPDLVRQYSLCGDPAERRTLRVAVLHEPAGRGGSAYVHERLLPGDKVRVRGPRNNFPLVPAPRYRFVAGGIGITPLLPMVAEAQSRGADWHLTYGGRTRASMAFLDELRRYGDRVVVRPQDEYGLLDLAVALGEPDPRTAVYCCGPEPLLAAVEQRCAAWPPGALHVERFSARPVDGPDTAFEIQLASDGRTLAVPAGCSVLSVLEQAGLAVLSSCREGTCGTCETGVRDGVPDHRDSLLSEAERAANDVMMICVSRSRTQRLVLDL